MLARLIFIALTLLAIPLHAEESTSAQAVALLNQQLGLLSTIEPTVERIDQARLLVVRKAIEAVIADIRDNKTAGRSEITFQTMRLLQYLIIQYRFSTAFFGWQETPSLLSIYTPQTQVPLTKLKQSYEDLQKSFGIDDTPYTKITSYYFRQMEKLVRQVEQLPLDETFKASLHELLSPIGHTVAIAEQGDRPKTFRAAKEVLPMIKALYPQFNRLSSTSAGYAAILELQGLTETYAEFAQVDDDDSDKNGSCK